MWFLTGSQDECELLRCSIEPTLTILARLASAVSVWAALPLGKVVDLTSERLDHRVMDLADLDRSSLRISTSAQRVDVMTMDGPAALAAEELSGFAALARKPPPAPGVVRSIGSHH